MRFEYTDGSNSDFIELCHGLDDFLNELVGGEENRAEYIPYNKLDDIHDVILVYDDNIPIGSASFKKYDDNCAEVKRVFIKKEYRGRGISIKLMELLEDAARKKGYSYLILESGEPLAAAMALYRKIGYKVIPNYGQYKDMKDSICMRKALNTFLPLKYEVCGQLISLDGFSHHRRCFEYNVLIMVTEGTLYITSGDNPYTVSAGQYILLKAGEEHFGHQASTGRLSYMWVHFSVDGSLDIDSNGESAAYMFPEYGSVSVSGRVSLLFHQLMDLSLEEKSLSDNMLNCALSLLIMELSREYMQSQRSGISQLPPVVISVMEWIKANYYQPFTVSRLADIFGYQADYLSSLFKKAAGISIVRYTNEIRIKSAKTLLLNYELSIKETAYSCGFSDEKYFMKIFKQSEGMTPTQYKNAFCKKYVN